MASKTTKVRFVYCPKCRKLLTELSDIPVYKCGGCGTVLKAKYHRDDAEGGTSETLEENLIQKNEAEHNSEDNDSISSSEQVNICSPDAYISDVDRGRKLIESSDHEKNLEDGRILNPNALAFLVDLYCHGKKDTPESAENGEGNGGRGSNIRSPRPNGQHSFKGRSSKCMAQIQPNHRIQSKADNSLSGQERISLQLSRSDSDHVRSYRDKMEENTGSIGHSPTSGEGMADLKLVGTNGDLSKSRTTRISHAYGCSISTFGDGCNDHGLHPWPLLSKRALFKPQRLVGSVNTKGKPTRDDVFLNNKMGLNLGMQSQERMLLSISSKENNGPPIGGSIHPNQCEPSKPTRYGHPAREQGNMHDSEVFQALQEWMESDMGRPYRFLSGNLGYRTGPPNANFNDISSKYGHEEFLRTPNSHASSKLKDLELDRMELLKKVEELRDRLSRSCNQRGKEKENQKRLCYNNDPRWGRLQFYDTWNRPWMYQPMETISQHCGPSQMPFSEQATNGGHHANYSCLNCHPEGRHFSTQLHPTVCHNQGLCMSSPAHMCCCAFNHSPTSPQWHMDHEMVKHHKEKCEPLKRHCRPIAGAAPFIVCYSCCKLLQLPADFLLSRRKHHKLQCGACSKVLTFSLLDNTHILPYSRYQVPHPPSEIDSSTDVVARNIISTSDADDCLPGDQIAYSDDYGLSICKSYSTGGDLTLSDPPLPIPQSTLMDQKHVSSGSSKRTEERKKLISEQSGNDSEKEMTKSVSPSSEGDRSEQTSLEAKATAQVMGSPLHRLMGYSSPSEIINGSRDGAKGSECVGFEALADSQSSPQYHTEITEEDGLMNWSYNKRDSCLPTSVNNRLEEMNHGLESMKQKVSVNGKVVLDQLVKKAEKQAGPIQTGNYWYDSRAGFWGIMDQPCLGIIPPFIEEFNYPMRKDCAGGNTGILVNGRELHQKDLDLLSSRGLPTTKNMAYVIEIGGRVVDEESGEELYSLGKLAPTYPKK
ncbi:uncharacterized protein LOC131223874 isoform X2 [Magnolia sinica]|uniref:uncharacterized protein LOC131223874 isoform X2 n=1 Tax=Magnolia sinica TaxID=86752 RepID=UPI002658881F|nr:uncharacterized protein LOC131223874 isoform X2 [Magnolia sinica]